jgi:biopolymer transport protein ExbD
VLVLLIIFLVTMPIYMRELDLEVPRKSEELVEVEPEAQVVVEVAADGSIKMNGIDTGKFELAEKVASSLKNRREKIVFVGFDDELKYGEAVQIMDLVKGPAIEERKVALKMKDDKPAAPTGTDGTGATQP